MPDPTTLTDEELDAQIANPDSDDPIVDEPAEPDAPQPKPPEAKDPDPKPDPAADPEPEEPKDPKEPEHISRRESLRIQQVLKNLKQSQPETPRSKRTDALNYEEELDAAPEVIQRLNEDRALAESARYQEGLKQAKAMQWDTLLQIDAPQVETRHPQLNKNDAENFHPAIADSLNTWYLQMSGYDPETRTASNPGMRYSDFVDGVFELAEEIAATRSVRTQKNVAAQAKATAIRPDGSPAKRLNLNKDPGSMTDEELEAAIAMGIPKR